MTTPSGVPRARLLDRTLRAALASLLLVLAACGSPSTEAPPASPSAAPTATADAGQEVDAKTTRVVGVVEIQKPGETWQPLAPRAAVPPGSRLRAGADGEADVVLTNQGAVRLKPGTSIEVTENRVVNGNQRIAVRVEAGRLLHRFNRLSAGSTYRVVTPAATAGIRGTEFDVVADASQARVRVLSGAVEIENQGGRGTLNAREGATIGAGQAPPPAQPLAQNELDALAECSLVNFTVVLQRARRVATAAEMRNISVPLDVWASTHDGRYPSTLKEAGADGYTDNWNQPYRYEVLRGGEGFVIISNGPDRQPDTEDDLEYRRE